MYVAPGAVIHRSVRLDVSRGGTISIGPGCAIEQGCILATYGGDIVIGRGVFVGPYCVLYGHGGLSIGDSVLIAAHTVIIPANHGVGGRGPVVEQPSTMAGISIGSGCWLGCGVRVLDGVRIGDGSVIGAGAVVTHEMPAVSIAVGMPCRVLRERGSDTAGDIP